MIICKLIINKCKNIYIGVYWNDVGFPGFKLSGWANSVDYMVEGEQKSIGKRGNLWLLYFLLHVRTHLIVWHYDCFDRMPTQLVDMLILKEIELSVLRSFFRALVVSWGLSTTASEYSASGSLIIVSCSRLSLVDWTAWYQ